VTAHLCVGGPLNGRVLERSQVPSGEYVDYNCAHRGAKSKAERRRLRRRGIIPAPSMVWIHYSVLGEADDARADEIESE
jgi:hypothetical protein